MGSLEIYIAKKEAGQDTGEKNLQSQPKKRKVKLVNDVRGLRSVLF